MADTINNFYVNMGESIDKKIPIVEKSFNQYLHNRNLYDIILNPCTNEEVSKYISNLTVSKASGPNSIPTSILKNYTDQLIEPLLNILKNLSSKGLSLTYSKLHPYAQFIKIMIGPNVQTIGQFLFSQT